jgi:hypothetical protein
MLEHDIGYVEARVVKMLDCVPQQRVSVCLTFEDLPVALTAGRSETIHRYADVK